MSRALVALLVAPLVLPATGALAQPVPFGGPMRLQYTAAPGCPSEQEMRDAIAARVRAQPFADAAPSRLLVTLQSVTHRFQGTAELRDPTGKVAWTVAVPPRSGDCAAVMDALALSIAIELGPQRRAQRSAANRLFGVDGESLPAPPPDTPPPPAPPPTATVPQPSSMRVRVGATAALDIAASPGAPGLALAIAGDLGLRWDAFSISAEGRGDLASGGDVAAGVHVSTSRFTGSLVPCGHLLGVVVACGLVTVGAVRGTGNADQPKTAIVPHVAAGGRAGVELPIVAPLAIRLGVDGLLTLARPILRLDGRTVFSMPLGSLSVGGGFVVSF